MTLNEQYKIPSLLNSYDDFALKYGFSGIHCNSKQLDKIKSFKSRFSYVFYSAHTLEEIYQADNCGTNAVTISPIFAVENKGKPLGVEFLEKLNPKNFKADIYALGGIINATHLEQIICTPIKNFASIRYFL